MSESAELFALVHTGTAGDVDFYFDVCSGATRILELGCGHGRVLTRLARDGAQVVGLDNNAELLALAANALQRDGLASPSRVELVEADMRSFRLQQRFDRIVIPYNGLYALPSEAAQIQCLAQACAHLADGGLQPGQGQGDRLAAVSASPTKASINSVALSARAGSVTHNSGQHSNTGNSPTPPARCSFLMKLAM